MLYLSLPFDSSRDKYEKSFCTKSEDVKASNMTFSLLNNAEETNEYIKLNDLYSHFWKFFTWSD